MSKNQGLTKHILGLRDVSFHFETKDPLTHTFKPSTTSFSLETIKEKIIYILTYLKYVATMLLLLPTKYINIMLHTYLVVHIKVYI